MAFLPILLAALLGTASARAATRAIGASSRMGRVASVRLADPVDRMLAKLRTESFVVLPVGVLVPSELRERMDSKWEAGARTQDGWIYVPGRGWFAGDPGARPDGSGGVRELASDLNRRLHRVLHDEAFRFHGAELRHTFDAVPVGDFIHADGRYLTATLSFGPGTVIYEKCGGRWRDWEAPSGAVVVLTNTEREIRTGVAATMHSPPRRIVKRRHMLQIKYAAGEDIDDGALSESQKRLRRRLEQLFPR